MRITGSLVAFIVWGMLSGAVAADLPAGSRVARYYELLQKRPDNPLYFERLMGAWDEITYGAPDKFFRKRVDAKGNDSAVAGLLLAVYLDREGQEKAALDAWKKIPVELAGRPGIKLFRAGLEYRNGNAGGAVKLLRECLKDVNFAADKRFAARELLVRALLRDNQEEEAKKAVADLMKEAGNDPNLQEAVIELQVDEGLYNDAVKSCRDLLKKTEPGYRSGMLRMRLAELNKLLGDNSAALDEYAGVLEQSGSGSWLEKEAAARIRQIFMADGNAPGLLDLYRKILKGKRSRPELTVTYIRELAKSGSEEEACKEFAALIKRMPTDYQMKAAYADLLAKTKHYKEAIPVIDELLRRKPDNTELLLRKAASQAATGDRAGAVKTIQLFLKYSGKEEFAWNRAAMALMGMGLKNDAAELYDRLVKEFPASQDAVIMRARFLAANGREKEALDALRKAAAKGTCEQLLRVIRELPGKKNLEVALELLNARRKEFSADWNFNMELVRQSLLMKNQEIAVSAAEAAVGAAATPDQLDRSLAAVEYVYGKYKLKKDKAAALRGKKKLTAAEYCLLADLEEGTGATEKFLQAGLKQNPGSSLMLARYAGYCREHKKYDEAIKTYERLLNVDPEHRTRWRRDMLTTAVAGNKADMVEKLTRIWLNENANSPEVFQFVAAALRRVDKSEEAAAILKRGKAAFPDNRQIVMELAVLLDETGKRDMAFRLRRRRIEQEQSLSGKLVALELLIEKANYNQLEQAKKIFTRNHQARPKAIFPVLALARLAQKKYDMPRYRELLTKALELKKDDPEILCKIAQVDEQTGHHQRAEELLLQAVKFDKGPRSLNQLSGFYFRIGETEKAIRLSLGLDNKNASTEKLLRAATGLISADEPERALVFISEALKKKPSDPKIHYAMGLALKSVTRDEAAARHFLNALDYALKLPDKASAINMRGNYWDKLKNIPDEVRDILAQSRMASTLNNYYMRRSMMMYSMYGGYSGMGSGDLIPDSQKEMKTAALAQLAILNGNMSPDKSAWLMNELRYRKIPYPELRLGLPLLMRGDTGLWKQLASRYPKDLTVAMVFSYLGAHGIGGDVKCLETYFNILKDKHPREAFNLIAGGWRRNLKFSPEITAAALKMVDDKEVPISSVYMLYSQGERSNILNEKQKNDLLEKMLTKIDPKDNTTIHYAGVLIIPLLKNGDMKNAARLFKIMMSQQSQSFAGNYPMPRLEELLRQSPVQSYVIDRLYYIAMPQARWLGGIKYRLAQFQKQEPESYKKVVAQLKKLLENENCGLQEVFFLGIDKKDQSALKNAEAVIVSDKKTPEQRLFAAALLFQYGRTGGILKLAMQAKKLYKDPMTRQTLLALVICGALNEPENKQAALDAEKAALELAKDKLNERELGMVASALHRLKRTETAEVLDKKLMEMIKKKQAASRTSSSRPGSRPVYYNQWQKTQQLLRDGKFKEALPLVKKEYYSRFMQSLQQQRQYGNYNFSYAGSIVNSVKRYGKDKELLEILRPKDKEPPVVSLLMYAYACESLKKNKEAYQAYLNAFKRYPDKKEVISILLPFVVKNKDTDIKAFVNMIPAHRLRYVLDSVSRNQYQYNGNFDRMLDLFEVVMAKQRTSGDKDLLQFDQNSFYLLCNMFINIGFPELRQRHSYYRNSSNKQNDKKNQEQARKLLGEICDHVIKTRSNLIQSAMEFKLLLAGDDKNANDKLYLAALAMLKNKKMLMTVNPYSGVYYHHSMYGGQNGNKPLLEFMVSYAIRHKRVPELVKAIGDNSITKGIDQVAELYKCQPAKFPEALKKFLEDQKVFNLSTAVVMGLDAAEAVIKKAPDNINGLVLSKVSFGPVYANQNFPQNYIDILLEKKQDKVALDFLEQFAKKLNSPELTGQYANQAQYQYNAAIQKILNKNPEKAFEIWKLEKSFKKPSNQQTSRYHNMRNALNQMANDEKKPRWELFGKTPQEFKYYPAAGGYSLFTTYVQYLRNYRNKFPAYAGNDFGGKMLNLAIAAKRGNDIYNEFAKLNDQLKTLPEQDRMQIYSGLPLLISELNLQAADKLTGVAEDIRRQATRATSVSATQKAQEFIKTARGANVQGYQYSRDAISLIEGLAGNSELIDKVVEHTIKELKINRNYHYQRNNYEITNFLRQLAQKGERSLPTLCIAWRCILKYPDYTDSGMYNYISNGVEQACYRAKRKNDAQGFIGLFDELPKAFGDNPPFLFPILVSSLHGVNRDQINVLFKHINSKKYPVNATAKECVLVSKYLKAKKSKPLYQKQICDLYEQFLKTDKKMPDKIKQQMLLYSFQRNHLKDLAPFMVDYALKDMVRSGNLYDNHQYYTIAKAMAECPDSEQWRKSAKTLLESFSVSGGNPSNHTYRRLFAAMLEIAIRLKNKKQIEALVKASLRFKQSMQELCITLLNNGFEQEAMVQLQTEIAKPYVAYYSNTRLSDAGWKNAKKLLSQVKDPEKQLLFSAILLPLAPNRSDVRRNVENEYIKLMDTYQKHKFSSPQVRNNFLMRIFRANSSRLGIIKRDFRKMLREMPFKKAMNKEYDPFRYEIARALVDYFIMKDYKAYKAKLDELAAFAENMSENSSQGQQCRTILSSMPGVINNYAYTLKNQEKTLTPEQIKLWADALTVFMKYNPRHFYSGEYLAHIMWLNHLSGNDKASLKVIESREHQLKNVRPGSVTNKLRSLLFVADTTGKSREECLKSLLASEPWKKLTASKTKEFAKEKDSLLKARELKPQKRRRHSNSSYQQRRQLQEMFVLGQDKEALALAAEIYLEGCKKAFKKSSLQYHYVRNVNFAIQETAGFGLRDSLLKSLKPEKEDSSIESQLIYACACIDAGKSGEALKVISDILNKEPGNKPSQLLFAVCLVNLKDDELLDMVKSIPAKRLPLTLDYMLRYGGSSSDRENMLKVAYVILSRPEWSSPEQKLKLARYTFDQLSRLSLGYIYPKFWSGSNYTVNISRHPEKTGKAEMAWKLLDRAIELGIGMDYDNVLKALDLEVFLAGKDDKAQKKLFGKGLAILKRIKLKESKKRGAFSQWQYRTCGDMPFIPFMIVYAIRHKRTKELADANPNLARVLPAAIAMFNSGNDKAWQAIRDFLEKQTEISNLDACFLAVSAASAQGRECLLALNGLKVAELLKVFRRKRSRILYYYFDVLFKSQQIEIVLDLMKQLATTLNTVELKGNSKNKAMQYYASGMSKLLQTKPDYLIEIYELEPMLHNYLKTRYDRSRRYEYQNRIRNMAYHDSSPRWHFFGEKPGDFFTGKLPGANDTLFGLYVRALRDRRKTGSLYSGKSFGGKIMEAALKAKDKKDFMQRVDKLTAKLPAKEKQRILEIIKPVINELRLR